MKSGAGDDPFSEADGQEGTEPDEGDSRSESMNATSPSPDRAESDEQATQRIPYKFRRDTVKEGREPATIFLQEETEDQERSYVRELEEMLDEDVSKIDAREAALIAAHRNPEVAADVLREWGYDLSE
jgi:hypothetical protein